ncbi:MAG: 5-formyltetrahydrofolate cyclo-ligase [Lachnospiraceae bacterium]|nr:5-formyltetrahydrofolate cyclo-ligase [Lachnospiraceae bacterium]
MEEKGFISKQSIRNRYLSMRNNLSVNERLTKSRKIWELLKKEPAYRDAEAVLVYMDYRSEVMTTGLVEELLADPAKRVFAPRVLGMNIRFYEIETLEELEPGYQGIREPAERKERLFDHALAEELKSLILIPGAVFDRQRGRMGYGKGFYDRFLKEYKELSGAALAFECQIAKNVPMEEHDIRPDIIVTEGGVIR